MPPAKLTPQKLRDLLVEINPSAAELISDFDVNLYEVGAIDSFSIFQMVQILEERYSVVFDYNDLDATNLKSINTLFSLLSTKYKLG